MRRWAALLLLVVALPARAQDPASAPPVETIAPVPGVESAEAAPEAPHVPTPEERLNQAVRDYQEGKADEARVELAALVNDPEPMPPELRQQARVYLGEVLYVQGQEDAAFKVFEVLLQEDPAYRVDPFRHPPDVCGFFEVVRASVTSLNPQPVALPKTPLTLPSTAWVGFGVYQRSHGERRLGTALLIGQTAFGLASAAGYGWLVSERHYSGDDALTRLQVVKAAQWGMTAGFWGMYVWGTLDARQHWRESNTPSPAAGQR